MWKLIAHSLPTLQCGYIVSLLESLKLSTTIASQRKAYEATDKRHLLYDSDVLQMVPYLPGREHCNTNYTI